MSGYDSFREAEWAHWEEEYRQGRRVPSQYARKFERDGVELDKPALHPPALTPSSHVMEVFRAAGATISKERAQAILGIEEEETIVEPSDEWVGMSEGI